MGPTLPEQAVRWVLEALGPGSSLVSARHLSAGGWHVNHVLEIVDGRDRAYRLVLRRWARPGWEVDDPDYTADRETRVLDLLAQTAVPAPTVVAADPQGSRCDVPALLLTCLDGHPPSSAETDDIDAFCSRLAETLAWIHDAGSLAQRQLEPYRLYYDRAHARLPGWIPATPIWEHAAAFVREQPPPTAMSLIHRDYHPENTLWSHGRLTGVVDWTQASWGPLGLDLGHMRWNLVAEYGQHAADTFLAHYRAAAGRVVADQAYWDLVSLFDVLLLGDEPGDIDQADLDLFEGYAKTALSRGE